MTHTRTHRALAWLLAVAFALHIACPAALAAEADAAYAEFEITVGNTTYDLSEEMAQALQTAAGDHSIIALVQQIMAEKGVDLSVHHNARVSRYDAAQRNKTAAKWCESNISQYKAVMDSMPGDELQTIFSAVATDHSVQHWAVSVYLMYHYGADAINTDYPKPTAEEAASYYESATYKSLLTQHSTDLASLDNNAEAAGESAAPTESLQTKDIYDASEKYHYTMRIHQGNAEDCSICAHIRNTDPAPVVFKAMAVAALAVGAGIYLFAVGNVLADRFTTAAFTDIPVSENTIRRSQVEPTEAEAPYAAVYNYGAYRLLNRDLSDAYGDDRNAYLEHFINAGMAEGRRAGADFDVQAYRAQNPDLAAIFGNDLAAYYTHYMQYGAAEGRPAT